MIDYLLDKLAEFIVVAVASAFVAYVFYKYDEKRKRVKITTTPYLKENKLGFIIKTENKTLRDARVYCNNVGYPWKIGNIEQDRKDLFVGEQPPSVFYPFIISTAIVDGGRVSKYENRTVPERPTGLLAGALTVIKGVTDEKIIYTHCIEIHRPQYRMWGEIVQVKGEPFTVSIKLVADGIEEERSYPMRFHISFDSLSFDADGNLMSTDFKPSLSFWK